MAQIAVYIEDDLLQAVDRRAKLEGKNRSIWVKEAIQQKLKGPLPETWFQLWGTWEDNRSIEEITTDIDADMVEPDREIIR